MQTKREKKNSRILIDDGKIILNIEKVFSNKIQTEVINGGKISNKKGNQYIHFVINIPNENEISQQQKDLLNAHGISVSKIIKKILISELAVSKFFY